MIFDSHVHIVSADHSTYPLSPVDLPNGAWFLDRPVDLEGLASELREAGVGRAALVQARGAYGYDNAYLLDQLADGHVVVAIPDPTEPGAISALGHAGCAAVRLFDIPTGTHPDLIDGVAQATQASIVAVACVLPPSLPSVAEAARASSASTIVLDHCGFVDLDEKPQWDTLVAAFRDLPNVVLKVTSHVLLGVTSPSGTVESLVEIFGAERLMWGSDFPQTPDATYQELVDLAHEASRNLSAEGRAAFLGGTAARVFAN